MTSGAIPTSAAARLAERLLDRVNPVLVKEIRQALRGNYFRWTFWVTVSGATVLSLAHLVLSGAERADGQQYFALMFACLAIAAHGLVPFFAFVAMGGEWEENTYDLLCLSDLKPRQIVLGKILAASVQSVLYYSAFGPFLIFAFLLQGVDLVAVAFLLAASVVFSTCLSTVAVAISTLSAQRYVRMLLHAALAAALVMAVVLSTVFAEDLIGSPQALRDPIFPFGVGMATALALWTTSFAFAIATGRLAHVEENHSTFPRLLALLGIPAAVGGMFAAQALTSGGSGGPGPFAFTFFTAAGFVLFVTSLVFSTEPERLGKRVRLAVPARASVALLVAPLLPGGGRGLVFFMAASTLLAVAVTLARVFLGDHAIDIFDEYTGGIVVALLYGFIYLALPEALRVVGIGRSLSAGAMRVIAIAILGAGILVPSAVGFFLDVGGVGNLEHAGNPVWVLGQVLNDRSLPGSVIVPLAVVVAIGVLLNVPRIGRSFAEVRQCSATRRERERAASAAAVAESHAA